ncbi:hypothetical protein DFO70_1501, partial [Cytobacillus firmus]
MPCSSNGRNYLMKFYKTSIFYSSQANNVDNTTIRELFIMLVSEAWNLYKADKQIQGYSSQT